MAQLFKMGAYDLTEHIVVPTYKVNEQPAYEEWKDANYTIHREITRTKVQGSFTVQFSSLIEFEEFLNAYESNTVQDGSTHATVYSHNKVNDQQGMTKTTYVFMDFDPADTLPVIGSEDSGFEITISER